MMLKQWLCALAVLLAGFSLPAEEPILRVGLMTDTHINEKESSFTLVRKAFDCFKAQKADLIVHLGDIAEVPCPPGYGLYRKFFQEAFPENPPKELFLYATHDSNRKPEEQYGYLNVKEQIGASNDPVSKLVLKGYPFLTFPQPVNIKEYEQILRETCAEFPGKPVFVLNHEPPYNTAHNTSHWGNIAIRKVLEHFPQVIHFSGHSHNSLRNEAMIWQGNFTAINAGCLQVWGGETAGSPQIRKPADGVLLAELYADRLVIRRFELLPGKEYAADRPWIVPLPFDPATAPYNHARLRETTQAPQFPADPAAQAVGNDQEVLISSLEAAPGTMQYQVELQKQEADGSWKTFARHDEYSNFYQHNPAPRWQSKISNGIFSGVERCRALVTPVNFFGKPGKPITIDIPAVKQQKTELIWQTDRADQDCKVIFRKKQLSAKDGLFLLDHKVGSWACPLLYFPEEAWNVPAGAKVRVTMEFESDLTEGTAMVLRLRYGK
ncbi:MAG: metallophosphoesterase [Lentisphaeria bacterium]|nr:metallophosphoesterase [Lentisphaeria bacterium]